MKKLLDVKNDFVFKKIFGNEHNLDILLNFLNHIFRDGGQPELVEVSLVPTELLPDDDNAKQAILDVRAKTTEGIVINIEMQIFNPYNMPKRTLFYWSHMYYHQLKEGQKFNELKRCVTINVLNFKLVDNSFPHNIVMLRNIRTNQPFNEDLEIHTLELPKLLHDADTVSDALRNWMLFILNANAREMEAIRMQEPMIDKAMKSLEVVSEHDIMWAQHMRRDKYLRDQASLATLGEDMMQAGWEQGLAKGLAEGLEQGIEQGIERGIEQGTINKAYEIARNMLAAGMDITLIASFTQLTEEEIQKLR